MKQHTPRVAGFLAFGFVFALSVSGAEAPGGKPSNHPFDGKAKNQWDIRAEGTLKVGDQAPDVTLKDLDGKDVQLASLIGPKPVFLVFGSYT